MAEHFEHYPADPRKIVGIAAQLFRSSWDTHATVHDVETGAVRTTEVVDGDLLAPMRTAHVPAARAGSNVTGAAQLVSGAMLLFAEAVTTYNAHIDRLNAQVPEGAAEATAVGSARLRELRAERARRESDLDDAAALVAGMLRRGPNPTDLAFLQSQGYLPPAQGAGIPMAMPVLAPNGQRFRIGPPTKPGPIPYTETFPYDPNAQPSIGDYWNWWAWNRMLEGGWMARPDLDDALPFYKHYLDATGTPRTFDYEEAYNEDAVIREGVDNEIARAAQGAEDLIRQSGQTSFSMTGRYVSMEQPSTENWQKTIGAHHGWSSADVRVDGNKVTMTVTVHAEDRYNFNRGANDIATGESDDPNGRFAELGWAKGFDSSGQLTRTVTWTLGDPPSSASQGNGEEDRVHGEDRRGDFDDRYNTRTDEPE